MRLISADGRWWWNGQAWQPLPEAVAADTADGGPPAGEPELPPEPPDPASVRASEPLPANTPAGFMPGRYDKSAVLVPVQGVAGRVYNLSGGRINLGPRPAELRHMRLLEGARTPSVNPPLH